MSSSSSVSSLKSSVELALTIVELGVVVGTVDEVVADGEEGDGATGLDADAEGADAEEVGLGAATFGVGSAEVVGIIAFLVGDSEIGSASNPSSSLARFSSFTIAVRLVSSTSFPVLLSGLDSPAVVPLLAC